MGYQNRDYFRDGSYTRSGSGDFMSDAPMSKKILIVTAIVFIAQMFFTRPARVADYQHQIDQIQLDIQEQELPYGEDAFFDNAGNPISSHFDSELFIASAEPVSIVQDWLKLDTEKVLKKAQIWRLITSAFGHDRFGIMHIVFNMLFLYWFGQFVESTYGSTEFLCFYLAARLLPAWRSLGWN